MTSNQLNDDIKMLKSAGFKAIAKQYEEMAIALQIIYKHAMDKGCSDKIFRSQAFSLAALKLRRLGGNYEISK